MTTDRATRSGDVSFVSIDPARTLQVWSADGVWNPPASRPGRDESIVDQLRHAVEQALRFDDADAIAAKSGVPAARIVAFVTVPETEAGVVLSLDEAARLISFLELRLEDRETVGELSDMRAIAECYIEIAMADGIEGCYDRALHEAQGHRLAFRRRHGIS